MNGRALAVVVLVVLLVSGCFLSSEPPSALVVNNSADLLHQVLVGSTVFSENLGNCNTGCATGSKDVASGINAIAVHSHSAADPAGAGSLGAFRKELVYAVNIRTLDGAYCAELWELRGTDVVFNEDETRRFVDTTCQ